MQPCPPYTFEELILVDSGGYDWCAAAVFQRSDGAYAVHGESGCSCSYFMDGTSAEDLEWFHDRSRLYTEWDNAVDALSGWDFSIAEKAQAKADLRHKLGASNT